MPSVAEFRSILKTTITLDMFSSAHNASLLSTFLPRDRVSETIDTKKYKTSEFAKKLDLTKPAHLSYLEDAIAAYEHFIAYLQDEDTPITHT